MSGPSDFQPTNPALKWIERRLPIMGLMLGLAGPPSAMSMQEAAAEWGKGTAEDTMASNSRVRAKRAPQELGWKPNARGLIDEIERGCYRE